MTTAQIIDAYWAGDIGDVEFTELALQAGMSTEEIGKTLAEVREEDGSF
jgi:hypothetical protein